jgi:cation transport ATPase
MGWMVRVCSFENGRFKNIFSAVLVFALWFAAAYLLNGLAIWFLVYAAMGGSYDPPALWLWAHWLGMNVLPAMFLLGGLPAAVQALRGYKFVAVLLVSLGTFAFAWLLVMAVIFWLPGFVGWYW